MQVEASLKSPRETLQIPYPQKFNPGDKTHIDDREIIAGYEPRYYTEPELAVVEAYLPRLPYSQSLIRTGAILIGDDILLTATDADLDLIEVTAGLPSSRQIDSNCPRSLRERVLIVRELGYRGGIITVPAPVTPVAPVTPITPIAPIAPVAPVAPIAPIAPIASIANKAIVTPLKTDTSI